MLTGAIAAILLGRSLGCGANGFKLFNMIWEGEGGEKGRAVVGLSENALGQLVWLGCDVSAFTPATYRRHRL